MDSIYPRSSDLAAAQIISISRSDRWQAHHRLQELDIPCKCLENGQFQAAIHSPIAALQLWSVIYQLTASRQQLVHWLENCWSR